MTRFIFFDNAINVTEDQMPSLRLGTVSCACCSRGGQKGSSPSHAEELMVRQPFIWVFLFLYMAISAYVILNLARTLDNEGNGWSSLLKSQSN